MNEMINLTLTEQQAFSALSAVRSYREILEHLRQNMIADLVPQEEIRAISREAARLAEVGKTIEEAL